MASLYIVVIEPFKGPRKVKDFTDGALALAAYNEARDDENTRRADYYPNPLPVSNYAASVSPEERKRRADLEAAEASVKANAEADARKASEDAILAQAEAIRTAREEEAAAVAKAAEEAAAAAAEEAKK